MRKRLLAFAATAVALALSATAVIAQDGRLQPQPSDDVLHRLAHKYITTPITKTVTPAGDVLLQRSLTPYLQATVQQSALPAADDHGHDHKDEMLRTFLNRPHPSVATLNKYFADAATEFNVPVELLKAIAQVQSNWTQVSESMYGSWGIMGLLENKWAMQISMSATILNTNTDAVKNDTRTAIRAAAALLSLYQAGRPAAQLSGWFDAVKTLTALPDAALNHQLALRIFDVLKTGYKTVTLWDEIIEAETADAALPKSETEREFPVSTTQRTLTADYGPAIANFAPACNYGTRPAGAVIKYYFVHYVATGTYLGAIAWFKDCASSVSAHYIVRNYDGQVSQVVTEADRAYSQGVSEYNNNGIGVEHEVLASNLAMWDSEPMLTAAAALCKSVCTRRNIPTVRRAANLDAGIYGHSDVRPTDCPNMTPERWTMFLGRVNGTIAAAPLLYSVASAGTGTQVTATWKANAETNLVGYRLYYATNESLTGWALAADETTLTAATTSVTLSASQFIVPPVGDAYHFRLRAVIKEGANPATESAASDVYSRSSNTTGPKVLIVDGFDRNNGSYLGSAHAFAASYFKALRSKAALQISTVANEKVEDGTFSLNNYDIVVWFTGDESSVHVVFSTAEKTAIKNFLDAGGKLMLSGAEIGYNLGRTATPANTAMDLSFMSNYLKSTYVADGSASFIPATGVAGTAFEGLVIPFGIAYLEDSPDAIAPINGSTTIFTYNGNTNNAGVAYKGIFGSGSVTGALVYLSYTLETAADSAMAFVMGKTLAYFDVPILTIPIAHDDVVDVLSGSAKRIAVLNNDLGNGVLLDPATLVITSNPANGTLSIDAAGNVTYMHNTGFVGTDSYRYQVQNTAGQVSNIAKVTITVTPPLACNPAVPEVADAEPKRDLRGAWVSTVSNIDWPSARNLSSAQQQAELINILNTLAATGINTVYLQVRPESDALYQSSIEPWSYWLTGVQGTAPNPLWDPLDFAVKEAHARGMELHAWLNPYRAKQSTPTLAANHVVTLHPEWTFTAGSLTMLNPGLPAVRQYVKEVIADIATRYDVDGIHFDDYFYPTAAAGFTNQDATTYTANNPTNIANIADWRRNNVNLLIAAVYDTLSVINTANSRGIVFGVSPFGIWKSGTPAGITGQSSFSDLYCDPVAWLQAGKVDYVAPQLYWKITGSQDYSNLSKWWNDQAAANNRYVYPGLPVYRLTETAWSATDIIAQIDLNRDANREQVRGQIMFSTKQLMANLKNIRTSLQNGQFKYKAVSPAMPWKDAVCPAAPTNIRREADTLRWDTPSPATDGDLPRRYLVYRFANAAEIASSRNDSRKLYAVVYGNKVGLAVTDTSSGYFSVTSLDKAGNESEAGANIALPITGLQLTVRLSGNTSVIGWRTLTETNTDRFEVERSNDGVVFTRLATVAAAGNSTLAREYGTIEFLANEGTFYYRIKSVDKDGRSSYSVIKSITYRNGSGLTVGPNPFRSHLNISGLQGAKQVELVDLAGRVVLSKAANNAATLQLSTANLPNGVYYLRVVKPDGGITTIKVVKI